MSEGGPNAYAFRWPSLFGAFSASKLIYNLTQGAALGFYITRLWRWGSEFSHRLGSERVLNQCPVSRTPSLTVGLLPRRRIYFELRELRAQSEQ